MAKERQQEKRKPRPIEEVRQEIAHTRDRLARDLTGLRYELDFPLKFRKSFQRSTKTWISAAVLTGVAFTARLASRKKSVTIRAKSGQKKKGEEQKKGLLGAGLTMGLLRFAATMLRPVVVSFVSKKMGSYAGRVK